jgi:hypothetical protein
MKHATDSLSISAYEANQRQRTGLRLGNTFILPTLEQILTINQQQNRQVAAGHKDQASRLSYPYGDQFSFFMTAILSAAIPSFIADPKEHIDMDDMSRHIEDNENIIIGATIEDYPSLEFARFKTPNPQRAANLILGGFVKAYVTIHDVAANQETAEAYLDKITGLSST